MATSLIAAGLAWYIKGPNAGLIVAGLGIVIVIILHIFGKKKEPSQTAPLMSNSGNATATGGSGGNATIGDIVLNIPPSTTGAVTPTWAPPPRPRPMLELMSCKATRITYEYYWRELDPIGPVQAEYWKPNASVAIFRLKPTAAGEEPMYASDATAHLTYRNAMGETQTVDYGTWLGIYEHKVSFRGNTQGLILSSTARVEAEKEEGQQIYVFDNPNSFNIFGSANSFRNSTINPPTEKPLLRDCTEVEVEIRMLGATLFLRRFQRNNGNWKLI